MLEPRHIIKFCIRRSGQLKKGPIDVQYDLLQELDLGKNSRPVRRLIQPLRPDTNLAYFEGKVERIESEDSTSEPGSKMVQALIDCGLPIVLESLVDKKSSSFPVMTEGEELIGLCRLHVSITASNSFFRTPLRVKVLAARTLESLPRSVLLKVEIASRDAKPENVLYYSRLDKKR